MNRFIPIIHEIIVVLQTNKLNEKYPRTSQKVVGYGKERSKSRKNSLD